jgi:hypothetical protein
LLASDDMFSTGLFSSFGYCYNSLETFLGGNQTFALIGAGSTGGQDMTPDFYDLHAYTDAVPATPDPFGCKNLTSVVNALGTTGGGYSALVSKLTQGGLILNFESHANRYVIAHEVIYCTGSPRGGCPVGSPGPGYFNNVGRPFFGMVWWCHSNQFADGPVLAEGSIDSSDAIGEQWLFLNNRGTIGSLGSTAYELVDQNSNFSLTVADAFFTIPPAPEPTSPRQARWILGEVFAYAQLTNGLSFDPRQSAMNHTVNLLADPMLRMDALPPRVFEVQLDGMTVQDGGLLVADSPADSAQVVAKMRDEVAIRSVQLTEQDLLGGPAVPIDSTGYTVAYSD